MLNLPKSCKQTNNYGLFINWHTYEVFKVSPNVLKYILTYTYKTLFNCLIEEKSQWQKNLMATSFVLNLN